LEHLVFLWQQGYNYRLMPPMDTHLTPELVLQLKQQLKEELEAYVGRASAEHPAAFKPKWQQWLTAVYTGVSQQIDALPPNTLVTNLVPSMSEVPAPDITAEDLQQFLTALHKRLVITRVDKAGKSYAAMCPAMYVTELRSQMGSACFEVCTEPAEALTHQAACALPMFFEHLRHQDGQPSLASSNLLVKTPQNTTQVPYAGMLSQPLLQTAGSGLHQHLPCPGKGSGYALADAGGGCWSTLCGWIYETLVHQQHRQGSPSHAGFVDRGVVLPAVSRLRWGSQF
jgi:hypothetical protein